MKETQLRAYRAVSIKRPAFVSSYNISKGRRGHDSVVELLGHPPLGVSTTFMQASMSKACAIALSTSWTGNSWVTNFSSG
jgi:hypothetical protein